MVVHLGEQTMTLFKRIFANGWQSLWGAITSFAALLAPAMPATLTAYCFITADLYYGYKVSKKYGQKQFESHKFWNTVNKYTEATVLICLALFLDSNIFMTYQELSAVKVAAGSVCIAEGISLLESLRALHPDSTLSKLLAKIIKSKADKYLDVDISDIIEEKVKDDTNNNKSN